MNKQDLITKMSEEAGVSKADTEKLLNAFTKTVTNELKKGGDVALVGFGTFKVTDRAARAGRNPRTGEALQIKAARVPKFSAGKALKDSVN